MIACMSDTVLDELIRALECAGRPEFGCYERAVLHRGVTMRMALLKEGTGAEYVERCRVESGERLLLLESVAINYSEFFRTPIVFELLRQLLPLREMRGEADACCQSLRVWSAGCAAGEEPYSLAIMMAEELGLGLARQSVLLFATDIDQGALARAHESSYRESSLQRVPLGVLNRYFKEDAGRYRLLHEHLPPVHFSVSDLTSERAHAPTESVFGGFDLVLCRNVLIYFTAEKRAAVVERLATSLVPGGLLVLGHAERIPESCHGLFAIVDRRNSIYRKRLRIDAAGGSRGC